MSALRALVLRPALARPGRALITIAGVAVGVASVLSTLLASRAAVASLRDDVQEIGGKAALEITRPGGVELADLAPLRELCGTTRFLPVVESVALAPALGDLVRVLGVDLLIDSDARDLTLDAGAEELERARETLLTGRGAALSRRLAGALGVGVGGTLELVLRSRPVELEVAALFDPPRVASAWDRVVLVDVALAQELSGRLDRVDRVELVPRADVASAALAAAVASRLPASYRVGPASLRREEGASLVSSLEFDLAALAGVSILVGAVLVATTLATSIVERRAWIALLRSLGASGAQIGLAVVLEAAAIGLLGGALGVLLGWRGALAALSSVRQTVASIAGDALPGTVRLSAGWIALGLGLGVLSAAAAAGLALREALRTPPLQGLRGERERVAGPSSPLRRAALLAGLAGLAALLARLPALDGRPVFALGALLALFVGLLLLAAPLVELLARFPVPRAPAGPCTALRLAQAALVAGRRRAAWAAGAVGLAVGLAVSMSAMVGSFRHAVVDWTARAMRADLSLRPLGGAGGVPAGTIDPEAVALAVARFGREHVEPYHEIAARVAGRPILLGGGVFAVAAREGGLPFVDGRGTREVFEDALARGAALVNESFALRFDAGRGDVIEIEAPGGTVRREIAGVYRDYSGHVGRVVLDLADFLALAPDEGARSVAVFLPEGADPDAERRGLVAELGGRFLVEVLDNAELRGEVLGIFERTFAFTVALQLVASVVAAIGIAVVLSALVHEERRELAVLRALGGSRLQLAGVVVAQALLLGLAGALGGLAVGLVVGQLLVGVVNVQSFGWTMDFAPPWGALGALLLWVLPASLLAGLLPAVSSLRTAPREALRELG